MAAKKSLSDLGKLTGQQAEEPVVAETPAAETATVDTVEVEAAEAPAPVAPQVETPLREQQLDKYGRAYATGRRKDAVARVWLKPGSGKIEVNGRDQSIYFARPTLRLVINQPFDVTERVGQYDVVATVKGGGLSGQAGAVKHGIAQALSPLRAGAAHRGQARRLPDPRQPRGRAQEVRPGQGPPQLPVLEALSPINSNKEGRSVWAALSLWKFECRLGKCAEFHSWSPRLGLTNADGFHSRG